MPLTPAPHIGANIGANTVRPMCVSTNSVGANVGPNVGNIGPNAGMFSEASRFFDDTSKELAPISRVAATHWLLVVYSVVALWSGSSSE